MDNKHNKLTKIHAPTAPEVTRAGHRAKTANQDQQSGKPIEWEMSSFDALRVDYIESHCSNLRN